MGTRRISAVILIFSALLLSTESCYYDNREDLLANQPQDSCNTTDVSFSAEIQPIISDNCAIPGCHNAGSQAAGLNLEEFQQVKNIAASGEFVGRITEQSGPLMPQGGPPLPQCEIDKITAWVQDGAMDN